MALGLRVLIFIPATIKLSVFFHSRQVLPLMMFKLRTCTTIIFKTIFQDTVQHSATYKGHVSYVTTADELISWIFTKDCM